MNAQQEIHELKTYISILENSLLSLEQRCSSLELDNQRLLKSNGKPIKPGVFTKVAIDGSGIVTHGKELLPSDIPDIPISSIQGLEECLSGINKSISELNKSILNISNLPEKFVSAGTGIRINYDKHGRVESAADLLPSDIPDISIDKISGLSGRLDMIDEQLHQLATPTVDPISVNPGMYTKVSIDNKGKIIKGMKLSTSDIPSTILSRISNVESSITTMASANDVGYLKTMISDKIDSIAHVSSGAYTKVNVNSSGLVTSGSALSMRDMPKQLTDDIRMLKRDINSKANGTEITELHNAISNVASNNSTSLLNQVQSHVQQLETQLGKEINNLKNKLTEVQNNQQSDQTNIELEKIMSTISLLSSRISELEK